MKAYDVLAVSSSEIEHRPTNYPLLWDESNNQHDGRTQQPTPGLPENSTPSLICPLCGDTVRITRLQIHVDKCHPGQERAAGLCRGDSRRDNALVAPSPACPSPPRLASANPLCSVLPPFLTLGPDYIGDKFIRILTVCNRSGRPLSLHATSDVPGVTLRPASQMLDPDKAAQVRFEWVPSRIPIDQMTLTRNHYTYAGACITLTIADEPYIVPVEAYFCIYKSPPQWLPQSPFTKLESDTKGLLVMLLAFPVVFGLALLLIMILESIH